MEGDAEHFSANSSSVCVHQRAVELLAEELSPSTTSSLLVEEAIIALQACGTDVQRAHAELSSALLDVLDSQMKDGGEATEVLVLRAEQLECLFQRIETLDGLFDQLYSASSALHTVCKELETPPSDLKEKAMSFLRKPLFHFGKGDAGEDSKLKEAESLWMRVPVTVTLHGASFSEFLAKVRLTVSRIMETCPPT